MLPYADPTFSIGSDAALPRDILVRCGGSRDCPFEQVLAGPPSRPFQHALIGFEIDEGADITTEQRYAAVLLPSHDGLHYRPAIT